MEVGSIIFTIWLEKSIFKNNVVNSPFRKTLFFSNSAGCLKLPVQTGWVTSTEIASEFVLKLLFLALLVKY